MNVPEFTGKLAIVAGGASGIGYATAKFLASSGATCAIWDIDSEKGQAVADELSSDGVAIYQNVDVTNETMIKNALTELQSQNGNPSVLVYTVGILEPKLNLWMLDSMLWQHVVKTNLFGCFFVCKYVVPSLLHMDNARIVIVGSVSGKDGSPGASAYSASKGAIIALTKSLAKELAPYGVLVNCVTPASTVTPLFNSEAEEERIRQITKIPLKRAAAPEEVAQLIVWLCSSACSFSTGAVFDISGGRSVY